MGGYFQRRTVPVMTARSRVAPQPRSGRVDAEETDKSACVAFGVDVEAAKDVSFLPPAQEAEERQRDR